MSDTGDGSPNVTRPLSDIPGELREMLEMSQHGRRLTDEERREKSKKWERRNAAHRHCSCCGYCDRDLAPDEPIWRQRVCVGKGIFGNGAQNYVLPICEECIFGTRTVERRGDSFKVYNFRRDTWLFDEGRECQGCGRMVHDRVSGRFRISGRRRVRRFIACCEDCRTKAANKAARDCRTDSRGTHECQECGETFEPSRTDAKFCKPACKQKAYRKSIRLTKGARRFCRSKRNAGASTLPQDAEPISISKEEELND